MKGLWTSALLALTLTTGCGEWLAGKPVAVGPWQQTREIVALVPSGPTTLFVDAAGVHAGFEYDLVNEFASRHGLKLRFALASSRAEALERLRRGEAHLAAGVWRNERSGDVFGPVYQKIEPVLVHAPEVSDDVLAQLRSGRLGLDVLLEHASAVARLKAHESGLPHEIAEGANGEALFKRVARGELQAALVDAYTADMMHNAFPQVRIVRDVAGPQELAWGLRSGDERLAEMVEEFFSQSASLISRLNERYYGHINRVDMADALAFEKRRETRLPALRKWFHEAEAQTGIDWRLIAALGYQESHWDQEAISPHGVRGIMMLTADTARALGVDRLDPYQSIMGGARYMRRMIEMIPERIAEPDRTWLGLAAYNVGIAHLEDARILTARLKKNPDSWADVKTVLPLLDEPEYFNTLKYGYARGGEPVIFVESLRTYFDILARFEKPLPGLSLAGISPAREAAQYDGIRAPAARSGETAAVIL